MLKPKEIAKVQKLLPKNDKNIAQTFRDRRLATVFRVLGDAKRCQIYRIFIKNKSQPFQLCVSDVSEIMKISIPSASQHLKILEITGLLHKRRVGQKMTFGLNTSDPTVNALIKAVM